jgi:hypothetical protein
MEILTVWENAKAFLNSEFISAALGALMGAWFGAWAAQRIAVQNRRRAEILKEIRECNAAIEIAQGICNAYLNLKEQHVVRLKTDYDEKKKFVHDHFNNTDPNQKQPSVLEVGSIDLRILPSPPVRLEHLEDIIIRGVSATRPRAIVHVLFLCVDQLNKMIDDRNRLANEYRSMPGPLNYNKLAFLYGLPVGQVIDTRYGDAVHAISKSTDDCIFFCRLIVDDLYRYAHRLRDKDEISTKKDRPIITKVSWSIPEKKGLFPDSGNYITWINGFMSPVSSSSGRWIAKCRYRLRKKRRQILSRLAK